MRTKLLIEVEGGVVQRLIADGEVEVYLVDHDNLKSGDDPRNAGTPGGDQREHPLRSDET